MDSRYERNIIAIGLDGQKRLNSSSALICGLGGLGSGVLAALAGYGVGKIGLLDFDIVSESNLNRQFIHKAASIGTLKTESASKFLKEFNPDIKQVVYNNRLQEARIGDFDVFVDCLDNLESKFFLNTLAKKHGVPLVHGGVEGFLGQVLSINPESACLNCFLAPGTPPKTPIAALPSVVNLISSIQATECLKILLNLENPLYNKLLRVDVENYEFKISRLGKNPDCKHCSGR